MPCRRRDRVIVVSTWSPRARSHRSRCMPSEYRVRIFRTFAVPPMGSRTRCSSRSAASRPVRYAKPIAWVLRCSTSCTVFRRRRTRPPTFSSNVLSSFAPRNNEHAKRRCRIRPGASGSSSAQPRRQRRAPGVSHNARCGASDALLGDSEVAPGGTGMHNSCQLERQGPSGLRRLSCRCRPRWHDHCVLEDHAHCGWASSLSL